MKLISSLLLFTIGSSPAIFAPKMIAQNPIQLFGPVDVRASQSGASNTNLLTFNTNTLNLNCPSTPTALLSSNSGGTGNVVVDNNIYVTNLTNSTGPTNVCRGGVSDGSSPDCFTANYQAPAGAGLLTGDDLDTFNQTEVVNGMNYLVDIQTAGVPPIDISSFLVQSAQPQQLKIDLDDNGGFVTSSSLYLVTNCTSGGVNGPAVISGNTIPPTNPTPVQLDQDFNFNPVTNNQIGFEYDLTGAYSAPGGSLTIDPNGVNPQVGDFALDPLVAYPLQVSLTSFATSMCLVHNGEILNGQAACKLFTLGCTTGTGNTSVGANCPVSSLPNEVFSDVFDGPPFTLPDIHTPNNGPVFHEGMGFLMASEGWTGGSCQFDQSNPSSDLYNVPCPQNLLTSFSGPGSFTGSGQTTHPNSTFITIAQVPEDLTSVIVTDGQGNPLTLGSGNWTNSNYAKLSSQPPNLTGTGLPGALSFIPSPIKSITYGVTPGTTPPAPGTTTDTTVTNSIACPTPASPHTPAAAIFATGVQPLGISADGNYLLHYYAQDCAGTKELLFTNTKSDGTGTWSTNFYTFPINVDTVPPQDSVPTLSPAPDLLGNYQVGEPVTATYSCTDDRSGIVSCGSHTYNTDGVTTTGPLMSGANTLTPGMKTFTVNATDAAGNKATPQSVSYQVVAAYDTQVQFTLSPGTVTYPLGTNLVVKVTKINSHVPTGTVKILDKGTPLVTLTLSSGAAYYYLKGLSAGMHALTAVYSGDTTGDAPGTSAPVAFNVLPVPVTLALACWNTPYPYGADFHCVVNTSSTAGAPQGSITYVYDTNSPITVPLASGVANIAVTKPPVGNHKIVFTYPAQTNYASAGPSTQNFTVTPAPVVVQFTPSSWYLTGGNLTLTATIQSWSAGPPNSLGTVIFSKGATLLSAVPVQVNASGVARLTIPATALPNGYDALTAAYSGSANYASGSTTITVQVAHP
jgi:hypothetical protein